MGNIFDKIFMDVLTFIRNDQRTARMGKEVDGFHHFSALENITCQFYGGYYPFLIAVNLCSTLHMYFVLLRSECDLKSILCIRKKKLFSTLTFQIGINHTLFTLLKTLTTSFLEAVILL